MKVAKEKLHGELSFSRYLRTFRLANFAFKVWLNRRQRESVQYFRRNTVQTSNNTGPGRWQRPFNPDRVVNECDYDKDVSDRRILYEMTGVRLNRAEFVDDTTDSED